ncbi:hypothetical protein C1645_778699 [Glomus cerebriforme]|uniref:Granulins domain-containing protein n=1 Tax=Glomus cerebriforme TaxID=658196 RepID=A0A397SKZ8_9GLOM|nr:hypothetical protein C1645_778699 [Glomus cerebriforme]
MWKNLILLLIIIIATFSNLSFAIATLKWRGDKLFDGFQGEKSYTFEIFSNHSSHSSLEKRQSSCPSSFKCPGTDLCCESVCASTCGSSLCCPPDSSCCIDKSGCCPTGTSCCGNGFCCPLDSSCCGENHCCLLGASCCGGKRCCPPDFQCCEGDCCLPDELCSNGLCVPLSTSTSPTPTTGPTDNPKLPKPPKLPKLPDDSTKCFPNISSTDISSLDPSFTPLNCTSNTSSYSFPLSSRFSFFYSLFFFLFIFLL